MGTGEISARRIKSWTGKTSSPLNEAQFWVIKGCEDKKRKESKLLIDHYVVYGILHDRPFAFIGNETFRLEFWIEWRLALNHVLKLF